MNSRQSRAREKKRNDPYSNIRSSGYGKRIPETKSPQRRSTERSPSPHKTSTPNNRLIKQVRSRSNSAKRASPSNNRKNKSKGVKLKLRKQYSYYKLTFSTAASSPPPGSKRKTPSGVFADPEILSSVQSFTSYIQSHFSKDGGFDISGINGGRPQVRFLGVHYYSYAFYFNNRCLERNLSCCRLRRELLLDENNSCWPKSGIGRNSGRMSGKCKQNSKV